MPMTPAQKSLRGQLGGYTSWGNTLNRTARTAPATAAARAKAAARRAAVELVDAEPLTPEELAAKARRNADAARTAFLVALSEGDQQ